MVKFDFQHLGQCSHRVQNHSFPIRIHRHFLMVLKNHQEMTLVQLSQRSLFGIVIWIVCVYWVNSEILEVPKNRVDHTCNSLSFVYIVGVEGVGHHGVSPAIAAIAKTCNKHVLYEMRQLRMEKQFKSIKSFNRQLEIFQNARYMLKEVVIIEDASFPSGGNHRNSTHQENAGGRYDLKWEHSALLSHKPSIPVKYLHLSRDFYRTVASHPEFDGGFERHAQVLHSFMWHINSEYEKINQKQPDIWRQINYEWFTNMDIYNCTAIVSAIIDFMEWNHCDVEYACEVLHKSVRKERKKEVNATEQAYAQTFNVNMSIPVLDISAHRKYNFATKVSSRAPVVILPDPEDEQTVKSFLSTSVGSLQHTGGDNTGAGGGLNARMRARGGATAANNMRDIGRKHRHEEPKLAKLCVPR